VLAVDTNVLIYAHRREAAEHAVALEQMRLLAAGTDAWAIPWPCVYEFYSVVTNPKIWKSKASTPDQAWAQIEAWAKSPTLRLLAETEGYLSVLQRLVRRPRVKGPMVHDARVVALCLAHGVGALLSRDRDFSIFPELPVQNPFD
jgi:toxin-antitoxin system PIN domain toxin